mgnify:CR=1 FL=1
MTAQVSVARVKAGVEPASERALESAVREGIADRYEVLAPLGRGGMGMVYRAHDRMLDETVAIKILRPDFGEDVSEMFNLLTGYSQREQWRKLIVAPVGLRERVIVRVLDADARRYAMEPRRHADRDEAARVYRAMAAKYGWQYRLATFLSWISGGIPQRITVELSLSP